MRRFVLPSVFIVCAALAAPFEYEISTDHADCVYACGEKAVFTVKAKDLGAGETSGGIVRMRLDNFGTRVVVPERNIDFTIANPVRIEGTLTEPGFLRLAIKDPKSKGDFFRIAKGDRVWSVGFEPEKIKPAVPDPNDFDMFWKTARERLEHDVPLDARMIPIEGGKPEEKFERFEVSFATFRGKRVYGVLAIPKDRTKGPFPVRLNISGAGPGTSAMLLRSDGKEIQFTMSVHPFPARLTIDGQRAAYEAYEAELKAKWNAGCAYPNIGIVASREEATFHDILLGMLRGLDWLAAQPYADRTDFTYWGGSQGGAFGIALTALWGNFRKTFAYVPAITDVFAEDIGRHWPWPSALKAYRKPLEIEALRKHWPYFDTCNFAARVTTPIRVMVGLADMACPPPGVYAAYNRIPAQDKAIYPIVGMPHAGPPQAYNLKLKTWLTER